VDILFPVSKVLLASGLGSVTDEANSGFFLSLTNPDTMFDPTFSHVTKYSVIPLLHFSVVF
jgi:hypothetical protein